MDICRIVVYIQIRSGLLLTYNVRNVIVKWTEVGRVTARIFEHGAAVYEVADSALSKPYPPLPSCDGWGIGRLAGPQVLYTCVRTMGRHSRGVRRRQRSICTTLALRTARAPL